MGEAGGNITGVKGVGAAAQSSAATSAVPEGGWTTRKLLKWMTDHFASKHVDSPRVTAEMLLAHVLKCERLKLYMEADRPASAAELSSLRELVARAAKHEPVQYLTGSAWFFSHEFEVDRSTLIPRPSTETLVQAVLEWNKAKYTKGDETERSEVPALHPPPTPVSVPLREEELRIADIGTGTGCIGISLALQLPTARVVMTDIVPAALELAKRNAAKHGVEKRMEFVEGDLVEGIRKGHGTQNPGQRREGEEEFLFDVIVSNPPYISDAEWEAVERNVKEYEPASALRGGRDGLEFVRRVIAEAPGLLKAGGLLAVEIAESQKDEALKMASENARLTNVRVLKDHEELWRVVVGERK
ncbi:MAG TPA: peptide chain release factor N(5)-glutamine methyltransferase [Phycisphaerales bacterium]|nr:peptide chain release factor N(5)-glutamine methyltransferase [Phycisphaerales bacterium]